MVAEILRDIPKPGNFDWVAEMDAYNTKIESEHNAPLDHILEDQEQEVRLQQDPCLPSPSDEPIPLGQGCSRQDLSHGRYSLSPMTRELRSMSRRFSAEPATRTLLMPSLVTAPNPRR